MPKRLRGSRYTPVAKRNDRPDAIAFLLRNFPQLSEAQVGKLLGTTKDTIQKVRERTHWNSANIKPRDPVILGLCSQTDLNAAVSPGERAAGARGPGGAGRRRRRRRTRPPDRRCRSRVGAVRSARTGCAAAPFLPLRCSFSIFRRVKASVSAAVAGLRREMRSFERGMAFLQGVEIGHAGSWTRTSVSNRLAASDRRDGTAAIVTPIDMVQRQPSANPLRHGAGSQLHRLWYDRRMLTDRDSLLRKLHELRSEHRDLDTVIARLAEQGAADQLHLQRLKKRKLMLRDEIAWLESRLIPDNIA